MPDFANDNLTPDQFEAAVRQVARQLYQNAKSSGSFVFHGRERDEVIDTGTELIIIESTQSRKLDKTKTDLKKSAELVKLLRESSTHAEYNFRIILVTSDDPTADQNAYLAQAKTGCPKEIISFSQLFARLFDARHYLRLRESHFFGSVRDPADETNFEVPASAYIPTALNQTGTGQSIRAQGIADSLLGGGRYILYGEYGSGKSMTLRDIYFRARDNFSTGKTTRCPIYLNLREHIAQTQPDEALYRHAERVGFKDPHSLISAWRSGFLVVFLDGFDELTPPQFASSVKNLRQARRFAVEIVKRFIEQTPSGAPIVIAGRESYFDTREEARIALGYSRADSEFDLAGFTDSDIRRFLKAKGANIPAWLPTRPLLLGYLANAGLLENREQLSSLDPANGWDQMLEKVCEREVSQVWGVGFEAIDLRLYIEGLATEARKARDGRGLEDSGLSRVFRRVFGRDADEPANLLTRRLPGLGSIPGRAGAREFIDADFADAASSGDIARYIESPFSHQEHLNDLGISLGDLGRSMVIARFSDPSARVAFALSQSNNQPRLGTVSADLITILIDLGSDYVGDVVNITDTNFDHFFVDLELNLSNIHLHRCIINTLEFGRSSVSKDIKNSIRFHDCVIDRLEGAMSLQDIPQGVLNGSTSVEVFSAYPATNDAVIRTNLPDSIKVLITILRKLFMQRGSGRQYSAFKRGLPPNLLSLVDSVTAQVKGRGFASDVYIDRRTLLVPNRTKSAEALSIINGPNTSDSALIKAVRSIVN